MVSYYPLKLYPLYLRSWYIQHVMLYNRSNRHNTFLQKRNAIPSYSCRTLVNFVLSINLFFLEVYTSCHKKEWMVYNFISFIKNQNIQTSYIVRFRYPSNTYRNLIDPNEPHISTHHQKNGKARNENLLNQLMIQY